MIPRIGPGTVVERCWCHQQYFSAEQRDRCMLGHFRQREAGNAYGQDFERGRNDWSER